MNSRVQGKKVLLVIANVSRRNLRATVFRNLGMDVVCASRISDARELWHPLVYDLVLLELRMDNGEAMGFRDDIKAASPAQGIAWLVGKPELLSDHPLPARCLTDDSTPCTDNLRVLMTNACEALPRRGGFLEARWRMALRRSATPMPAPARLTRHMQIPVAAIPDEIKSKNTFGSAVLLAEAELDGTS